jgi:hypothetical protein
MIVAPERHGLVLAVPENGAEGAEPIAPQDQLVAVQVDGVHVGDELLVVDGDGDLLADARQGDALAISDADRKARARGRG